MSTRQSKEESLKDLKEKIAISKLLEEEKMGSKNMSQM